MSNYFMRPRDDACERFSLAVKMLSGDMHFFCTDQMNERIIDLKSVLRMRLSPVPHISQIILTEMNKEGYKVWQNHEIIERDIELNLIINRFDTWDALVEDVYV